MGRKNKYKKENQFLWGKLDDYTLFFQDLEELLERFNSFMFKGIGPRKRYTTQLKKRKFK